MMLMYTKNVQYVLKSVKHVFKIFKCVYKKCSLLCYLVHQD